jgi:acetoin:2,6-dichlorophenolindophenol oxidoreductase subunit beta
VSIAAEECFDDLDGPIVRITTPHVPLPAAHVMEDEAMPSVERIVNTIKGAMR